VVKVVLVVVTWALLQLCLGLLFGAGAGIHAGFILFGYQKHIPLILAATSVSCCIRLFMGCWFNLRLRISTRMNYDRGAAFSCRNNSVYAIVYNTKSFAFSRTVVYTLAVVYMMPYLLSVLSLEPVCLDSNGDGLSTPSNIRFLTSDGPVKRFLAVVNQVMKLSIVTNPIAALV
jgi:hypothetical protein